MTENSVKIAQESFKSTLVDFTESMNENQQIVSRMTVDQSKEALLKAC